MWLSTRVSMEVIVTIVRKLGKDLLRGLTTNLYCYNIQLLSTMDIPVPTQRSWIFWFHAWKKCQTYSPKWWWKNVIYYHGRIRKTSPTKTNPSVVRHQWINRNEYNIICIWDYLPFKKRGPTKKCLRFARLFFDKLNHLADPVSVYFKQTSSYVHQKLPGECWMSRKGWEVPKCHKMVKIIYPSYLGDFEPTTKTIQKSEQSDWTCFHKLSPDVRVFYITNPNFIHNACCYMGNSPKLP